MNVGSIGAEVWVLLSKERKNRTKPPFLDPRHGPSGHHGKSKCTAILGHTRNYFRLLDRPKSSSTN